MRIASATSLLLALAISVTGQAVATQTSDVTMTAHAVSSAWPDDFRGVRFGSSQAEAEKMLGPMRCTDMDSIPGAKDCSTTDRSKAFRIDDEVVSTRYFFFRDRFLHVEIEQRQPRIYRGAAHKNLIGPLRAAFEDKYGQPTTSTGTGGEFTVTWSNATMTALISAALKDFGGW